MQKTVAIVDDHETIVMFLSLIMRRMGYTVMPARSGEELFEQLEVGCPDLVITDYSMPGMDGLAVIKTMKKDPRYQQIPVILMSAYGDSGVVSKSVELGCAGFVAKPIRVATLNRLLQECVTYPNNNKRRHLRCKYDRDVKIYLNGTPLILRAVTLSEGGVFLKTADLLPIGTRLGLELDLPDGQPLLINGTVIYQQNIIDNKSSAEPGIAIRFDDLSVDDSKRIHTGLSDMLTEGCQDSQLLHASSSAGEGLQERLSGLKKTWRGTTGQEEEPH